MNKETYLHFLRNEFFEFSDEVDFDTRYSNKNAMIAG